MQVAYVSSAGDRTIHVLGLDPESGTTTAIEDVVVPGPDEAEPISLPLAVSPDRRFLYAAIRTAPYPVSTFAIDPATGRLTHLGSADLPDQMAYIATDHTNRVLLGASYTGSKLAVMPIGADGIVKGPASQVLEAPRAHCIMPSTDNRSAYVALHGGDVVLHFDLDVAGGKLVPRVPKGAPTKPGGGPRHLALHPPTGRLFVLNERNGSVDTLSVDPASGALTPIASVSMLPEGYGETPTAADIHVTGDGRFVYASERTASFITVFAVDAASGRLTPVEWVTTEASPRGFAIDPTDRCLLVVGQFSGRMSAYRIDPATGRLTRTEERAVGPNPNWVEIVELG
jgi:6-phosphogluconolactonase